MTTTDTPIHQLLAAYRDAVRARDVDAFAALYDDDLQVFDLWARWTHEGLADWRAMATGWFGSLGDEQVQVDFADVRAWVSGDQASGSATLTFRALSADGQQLRSMDNRTTLVARHVDGAWKIVHAHSSIPIEPANGGGVFKRPAST